MQRGYNEIWMKEFPRVLDHMTYIIWETKAYMLKKSIEKRQAL